MSITHVTSQHVNIMQAADELQQGLDGKVFVRDLHASYEEARRGWNSAISQRPSVIVQALSTQDVVSCIAFAQAQELPLAIRSGGHNTVGLHSCDNGVMLDLGQMNSVTIDPERRIARAQPGIRLGAFVEATQAHGLATTTGTCSSVGLSGSTLGGGVGWLMSRYGMGIDNVLSFELVTADGEVLTASKTENPELFWGLRGGGGNFGVVTAIEFQLYPVNLVYGGLVMYPLSIGQQVLRAFVDLSASAPDGLMMHAVIAAPPQALGPVILVQACYSGDDLSEGERLLAPLRELGNPLVDALQVMPYSALYKMLDAPAPAGLHYYDTAYSLCNPSDEALAALVGYAAHLPEALGSIVIHQVRGAASRLPADATAFALRAPHFGVVNNGFWVDGDGANQKAWADAALLSMRPFISDQLYVNFMGQGSDAEVRAAYGANYARLAALKRQYDPSNFFSRNQNILPAL